MALFGGGLSNEQYIFEIEKLFIEGNNDLKNGWAYIVMYVKKRFKICSILLGPEPFVFVYLYSQISSQNVELTLDGLDPLSQIDSVVIDPLTKLAIVSGKFKSSLYSESAIYLNFIPFMSYA